MLGEKFSFKSNELSEKIFINLKYLLGGNFVVISTT